VVWAGQGIGRIQAIEPAAVILARLVREAEATLTPVDR
jgi:hypothetical protein